ncbi:P-loop containing nucleoside triphosphate hydrolase protein [Coniochaeta sp. 2T2.1]|nr:P-loop containing nucleoside triphosphate hydrolase protein [Coniochaeta sp. 2T2.1]
MTSPLQPFTKYILQNATGQQKEEMAIEIHLSITAFSIAVTKQFERGPPEAKMTPDDWKELELCGSATTKRIQNASQKVEISIRQANEQAQKLALSSRQATLALETAGDSDEAVVPCIVLPRASDNRFFDRTEIFEEVDSRLQRFKPVKEFCSVALHGLGGVGKSEIALQYAHSRSKEYDAVLWVLSENLNALETSFTDLCLKLGLKGAQEKNNAVNKVILKTWLQKTTKKWLIIFDNAWSQQLLWEYWPVANRGAVLVTTRNRSISFSPASSGIQVEVFNPNLGSQLLFSVLQRAGNEEDVEAAQALALSTEGLPLLLFNVAGLIQSKNYSIAKVVQMYEKHKHQVHRTSQDGRTIASILQLSFQNLSETSADLLGILSLLAPDAIPSLLFQLSEEVEVPSYLQFVQDEWT